VCDAFKSGRYDPLARKMFRKLFDIFDHDNKGVVDTTEFLGGLSVLASGERDEKIRYTFELYDVDNDGFITLEQMTKYLTAVFLVIAETSPEIFHHNE
jgi:Ca2+-binding EF-hand superfamily protein